MAIDNKNNMSLSEGEVLAIIWIVLNTCIIAPYASYQTYIFYVNKTLSAFLFNRKPDMVITFCISGLITLTIIMPLCYGWEIFSNKQLGTQHYAYIIILYFIAGTFVIGFWRAWHVWFDAKYKMEAAINQWAKHLNDSEKITFSKYKDSFGNSKWTKKRLIIIAIFLTCLFMLSFCIKCLKCKDIIIMII